MRAPERFEFPESGGMRGRKAGRFPALRGLAAA
jgi:hypothetical protein